jgi:hypothetical protein
LVQRLEEASKQPLPIVTDPTVTRADLREFLGLPTVLACHYILAESDEVISARVTSRGGSVTKSLLDKAAHYRSFVGNPAYHVGTSAEIQSILQKTISSKFLTYGFYELSSNQLIYIGNASNNGGRFANHASAVAGALAGKEPNVHGALYRYMARRILSKDNFLLKVFLGTNSEDEAYEYESRLIFEHRNSRTLFNVDSGGNGPRGSFKVLRREVSDETRKKLSDARTGFKFDIGYANRGCWRLSDDEVEIICGLRGIEFLDKDELGRVKLSDPEVSSIRNRRNLIKYHRSEYRKRQVLDWHRTRYAAEKAEKVKKLGVEVNGRLTHLASLSADQRHERRLKLASLHRKRRLAERFGDFDKVQAIILEISELESSFGVVPVNTSVRTTRAAV